MMAAPVIDETKCLKPGNWKLKICCSTGTDIVRINNVNAIKIITITAMFFSISTEMKFLVFESDVRIRNMFPIISEENAIALTSPSLWPS